VREIEPGHMYELDQLDIKEGEKVAPQFLTFFKRDSYPGTTIQEGLRAIIHRLLYVNDQEYSGASACCVTYARKMILELEVRAALRHGRKLLNVRFDIENEPTCPLCGHIQPETHNHAVVSTPDATTPASPPVEPPTGKLRREDAPRPTEDRGTLEDDIPF
jgi:hypothetical protein